MHPLLEKQDELHSEATTFLEQVLLPILTPYGDVLVGGSYSYHLLNHPDIDIDIVSEAITKEVFVKLSTELMSLEQTSQCKSGDRVHFPHKSSGPRPDGYFIILTMHFGKSIWNVDIWLQTPDQHTGDTNRYAQELLSIDEEVRITILGLKEELVKQNIYGVLKEFNSVDVYEGVLRGSAKTVDGLRDFVSKKRQHD